MFPVGKKRTLRTLNQEIWVFRDFPNSCVPWPRPDVCQMDTAGVPTVGLNFLHLHTVSLTVFSCFKRGFFFSTMMRECQSDCAQMMNLLLDFPVATYSSFIADCRVPPHVSVLCWTGGLTQYLMLVAQFIE